MFSTDNSALLPIVDRSPTRWAEAWYFFERGGSTSWAVLDLVQPDTRTGEHLRVLVLLVLLYL